MVEVYELDHNGRGIAKMNNKIVFIENALPGEIVNINIIKEKKNFIEARVTGYIKKSKDRIEPICPYFCECGGCDIMHMNYNYQLKFKENKIKNIIDKYLNENIKINNIVSYNQFNYRNKVTFQVKNKLGLYKKNSYEIINIDKCIISNDIINKAIPHLNKLDLKNIDKIICRTASSKLMIIIETNKDINIDSLKEIADCIYIKKNREYKHIYGDKYIYENIGNYKFAISPDSFFQVNLDVCTKLYNKIKEYIGHNKNILDLYCGTGSIGIFVNEYNKVLGIELNEMAITDANENKRINDLKNIDFICGDSGKKISNIKFKADVIIVDPPRSGLNKETIDNILKLNPKEIIYVSCDPMTLVRDLNILSKNYSIIEITPFDMFPNTKHVESVCLLKLR